MKLNHADDTPTDYGLQLTKFDEQVISRHHKVVDIIRRHLKDIRAEYGRRRRQGRDRPPGPYCAGRAAARGCLGVAAADCRGEETARVLIPAAAMGQRRGSLGLDQVGSGLMGSAVFAVVHHDFR